MRIGENIKKLRQWKEISQTTISELTGIPQANLSRIEAGHDFLFSKLTKIADALGCDVADLVCFDASKVTFNLIGNKTKGVVFQGSANEKQLNEVIEILKNENLFLRKMLEKSIGKKSSGKS